MLFIDATFGDYRIQAMSNDNKNCSVNLINYQSNEAAKISLTREQLTNLIVLNFHPTGMPNNWEQITAQLQPIFKDLNKNFQLFITPSSL